MFSVAFSLVPAMVGAIYYFGTQAGWLILSAMAAAVVTEAVLYALMKQPIPVKNGSTIVTGILLAFSLPAGSPWWLAAIGSAFAIGIGKVPFGGLGYNPLNPALLGRAFLMAAWPTRMTTFTTAPQFGTLSGIDAITHATPLSVYKASKEIILHQTDPSVQDKVQKATEAVSQLSESYRNLFLGNVGGCIGETSALLLLGGAVYLMYKRYIGLKIPVSYLSTVAILSLIFGGAEGLFTGDPIFHVLSGGLILGAFYMATDMVTSPVTYSGRIIFGVGCGVITVLIRQIGGYPEGVSYAILLMNLTVPLLDRMTQPKSFGQMGKNIWRR